MAGCVLMAASDRCSTQNVNFSCIKNINKVYISIEKSRQKQEYEKDMINDYLI